MTSDSETMTDARARLIAVAAEMIGRDGLAATSIRRLAKEAQAPLGSVYHYFPGGKRQLVAEALGFTGDQIERVFLARMAEDPVAGVARFISAWRDYLATSGFQVGCPVLAVSTQEPADADERAALSQAARIFARWEWLIAQSLVAQGVSSEEADDLATLILAATEGTVALCRARGDASALDQLERQLIGQTRRVVAQSAPNHGT